MSPAEAQRRRKQKDNYFFNLTVRIYPGRVQKTFLYNILRKIYS
jgi:hypothetical protein